MPIADSWFRLKHKKTAFKFCQNFLKKTKKGIQRIFHELLHSSLLSTIIWCCLYNIILNTVPKAGTWESYWVYSGLRGTTCLRYSIENNIVFLGRAVARKDSDLLYCIWPTSSIQVINILLYICFYVHLIFDIIELNWQIIALQVQSKNYYKTDLKRSSSFSSFI